MAATQPPFYAWRRIVTEQPRERLFSSAVTLCYHIRMHETLDHDSTPSGESEPTWRPESRFVPVRAEDLAALLASDADRFGEDAESQRCVLDSIRDVLEQEAVLFQRELESSYAQFNPDRETQCLDGQEADGSADDSTETDGAAYKALHSKLAYLLDKANFERLDDVRIAQVIARANAGKIRVRIHPDRVEFLELWVRGHGVAQQKMRTIRCPIRGVEIEAPVFKRMVVIARLKDCESVMIKLFKDIPEAEVEALLPHAEVAMTLLDRVKLFGAGAGAMGATAMKLANVALVLAKLYYILWILLIGLGTMALRTFFGYKNAKTSRDWRRTQRLYFQNLGNNASAMQLLIASVKQEEMKEAYLAYAFSLGKENGQSSKNGLRRRIEGYLQEKLGVEVDFDLEDAIETITRLELWRAAGSQETLPPKQAVKKLEKHCQQRRSADYHLEANGLTDSAKPTKPRMASEPTETRG